MWAQLIALCALAFVANTLAAASGSTCAWSDSDKCQLRSFALVPDLQSTLIAKIESSSACFAHQLAQEPYGCDAEAPAHCEARMLRSWVSDAAKRVCVAADSIIPALEDLDHGLVRTPIFQQACFNDGAEIVSWQCMRDLAVLSAFYGCGDCARGVRTTEAMLQACAAGSQATCESSTSALASSFLPGHEHSLLPLDAPRPDDRSASVRSVIDMTVPASKRGYGGGYHGYGYYAPPGMYMPPPKGTTTKGGTSPPPPPPPKSSASGLWAGAAAVAAVAAAVMAA